MHLISLPILRASEYEVLHGYWTKCETHPDLKPQRVNRTEVGTLFFSRQEQNTTRIDWSSLVQTPRRWLWPRRGACWPPPSKRHVPSRADRGPMESGSARDVEECRWARELQSSQWHTDQMSVFWGGQDVRSYILHTDWTPIPYVSNHQ